MIHKSKSITKLVLLLQLVMLMACAQPAKKNQKISKIKLNQTCYQNPTIPIIQTPIQQNLF
jgi:hypothetical protein